MRKLNINDLRRFNFISHPVLSPDANSLLYVSSRMNTDPVKNRYDRSIWRMNIDGKANEQLTHSRFSDWAPQWSPDGSKFIFLSNRRDTESSPVVTQLWIMPSNGEPKCLTKFPRGVAAAKWSPDGERILVLAFVDDKEGIRQKLSPHSDTRSISRLTFKFNGEGYLYERRKHLFVISIDTGRIKTLTEGSWDVDEAAWSVDSKSIYYSANKKDQDTNEARTIFQVPIKGGRTKTIFKFTGPIYALAAAPDRKHIAFIGNPWKHPAADLDSIFIVGADSEKARDLTTKTGVSLEPSVNSDCRAFSSERVLTWRSDGEEIAFSGSVCGRASLYSISVGDVELKELTTSGVVDAASFSRDHSICVYLKMNPTQLNEIWLMRGSEHTRISHFNDKLLKGIRLSTPQAVTVSSSDGKEVAGWVMYPPGSESKKRKLPAVLQIHGGPRTAYGEAFMMEFQLLAAEGFLVMYFNPRGSSSYGSEWSGAVALHFGDRDYLDLMEGVDHVLRSEKRIDRKRLGVTGGSYGGYMTNLIVTRSDRFKAACTQRSISNLISFYGTSDVGPEFSRINYGRAPWDNFKQYWNRSPLAHVDKVKTPMLIIHSEDDFRCPMEQAEQWFTALKVLGRDVELVRFQGENHELSRSGKPLNRIENLQRIIGWFRKRL